MIHIANLAQPIQRTVQTADGHAGNSKPHSRAPESPLNTFDTAVNLVNNMVSSIQYPMPLNDPLTTVLQRSGSRNRVQVVPLALRFD